MSQSNSGEGREQDELLNRDFDNPSPNNARRASEIGEFALCPT